MNEEGAAPEGGSMKKPRKPVAQTGTVTVKMSMEDGIEAVRAYLATKADNPELEKKARLGLKAINAHAREFERETKQMREEFERKTGRKLPTLKQLAKSYRS
jgi:hypothetical protein